MKPDFHKPLRLGGRVHDSNLRNAPIEQDKVPGLDPSCGADVSPEGAAVEYLRSKLTNIRAMMGSNARIMAEGREAALKMRRSLLTGELTKEIKIL